jgi:hypothetical protein
LSNYIQETFDTGPHIIYVRFHCPGTSILAQAPAETGKMNDFAG